VDDQYERLCDAHADQNAVTYEDTHPDPNTDAYKDTDAAADEYSAADRDSPGYVHPAADIYWQTDRDSQGDVHPAADIYWQTDRDSQGDVHAAPYHNAHADQNTGISRRMRQILRDGYGLSARINVYHDICNTQSLPE